MFTWSDNITFDAMAQHLDRPIMQLTYPRYVGGVKNPDLEPKFIVSKSGNRTKLPIYIHYNGINHYNTFVPRSYKVAGVSPARKPAGAQPITKTSASGMMLGVPASSKGPAKASPGTSPKAG